jgi:hypothetical protein
MATISVQPTTVWATGYNGTITIKNNTNTNFGYNWSISCTLPANTNVTWCDNGKYVINGNKLTIQPQSYTNPLNANVTIKTNFGGLGVIPTAFTFSSSTIILFIIIVSSFFNMFLIHI